MKMAYFGYDFFFGCFEKFVDLGYEITDVFSFKCDNQRYNYNLRLLERAQEIDAVVHLTPVSHNDLLTLQKARCDLLVSAGYQYKIPVRINDAMRGINIHPTLLPQGRGPWPLPKIILDGIKKSGVTIHKISESFDSGDILLQEAFPVTERENLETLSSKSQILAIRLVDELHRNFFTYWENARPQEGGGSYWKRPSSDDRMLFWDKGIDYIDRVVRAFGKFDSFAVFDNKEWIVQDATVWKENHSYEPGKIVHRTSREVVLSASDGFVCLRAFEIDPEFKG
jgi:methionyl-tRNA formyltransferase